MEKTTEDWIVIGGLKVDPRVLESRPVARCRIDECRALCCSHGVYVDLADAGRIVEEAEIIKPHLKPENRDVDNWFDGDVGADGDFPSGYRVGTQVVPEPTKLDGTTCVFLRADNRCGLQAASVAAGRHPWDLKPYYCALYPLILVGDCLRLDDDNSLYRNGATCQRAESTPVPLYTMLREELILALGEAGYRELCSIALARGRGKAMKIGLAFDLKTSVEVSPQTPDDGLEEYDPPETIEALASQLERLGHGVILLGGGRAFLERVLDTPVDLVFNIAEGRGCHRSREAQVPGVLEMLGIPYVGSDPLTLAVCLDKPSAKRIALSGEVDTPRYQVIETLDDLYHLGDLPLEFPVMVKPAYEGSSKGVHQSSRVEDPAALCRQVQAILDHYRQPALVEEFVPGIEVTVGVVGNRPPQVVGVMEVVPRAGPDDNFMYTLEVKRNWRQMVAYRCPPEIPPAWLQRVQDSALRLYRLLGCRDMARLDFRINRQGQAHFIEANPLPGLSPLYGDLSIMAGLSGWDYPRLIETILDSALARHGLVSPDNACRSAV